MPWTRIQSKSRLNRYAAGHVRGMIACVQLIKRDRSE